MFFLFSTIIMKSQNESNTTLFVSLYTVHTQYLPLCTRYIMSDLKAYWLYCHGVYKNGPRDKYIIKDERLVFKEGFVCYECDLICFDANNVHTCTPEDLECFALCKSMPRLSLLLKDRWFKGDFDRLKKIIELPNHSQLVQFIENCIWERSYEDNYTLGQQLSIRLTTNLIQSGLDFKHHINNNKNFIGRGWQCEDFEKLIMSISNVADITKRYKCSVTYIVLELDTNNSDCVIKLLSRHYRVVLNTVLHNTCLIVTKKPSSCVLKQLSQLILHKFINVVFVTDTENYLYTQHKLFYVYNSMKFYYYCLKNKFVFVYEDYETLYFVYTIIMLEMLNGGCLNTFTLEKSPLMHPLELNSRRCNALKRAANCNKTMHNDMDLKVDFIKGKRIPTGTHDPSRIVLINKKIN
nr:p47 [Cnaphalocrocis medinalis granulovirus]